MLQGELPRAEQLLLQQGLVEEAMEMYQELHKWEESIAVAEQRLHPEVATLKANYVTWLTETGQVRVRVRVRVRLANPNPNPSPNPNPNPNPNPDPNEVTSARALEEQKLAAARLRASRESKQALPRACLTPPTPHTRGPTPSPRRAEPARPTTRRPSLSPPPLPAVRRTSWRRSRMSCARRSTDCSARCSSRCRPY